MDVFVDGAIYISMAILSLSVLLAFYRVVRGPSLPDRIVGLDLVAYIAIAIMLVYAIAENKPLFLEVSLVLALIAFLGTVAFSRYLEFVSSTSDTTSS
ncbi:MAG: cation:proton antiporter [Longimonas sp.]|uniref:cation:proton antiporter n=1 Tax=Longimonas sp. TaxID=2039626 RepID=UPI00334CF2F1